jgi:hypothetical protein
MGPVAHKEGEGWHGVREPFLFRHDGIDKDRLTVRH